MKNCHPFIQVSIVREFFLFGVSGFIGFVVDASVLYALRGKFGPFVARGFSFIAAVIATWLFNRNLTFRHRRSSFRRKKEFLLYLMLMLVGGSVNYAIYALLLLSSKVIMENPIIGVAVGSLAGMAINLASSRLILFRHYRSFTSQQGSNIKATGKST